VVSSVYLPYDSEDPPPSRELEELVQYCDNEDLYLLVGRDSMRTIPHGAALTATVEGRPFGVPGFFVSGDS
jgi:hypothetical protein